MRPPNFCGLGTFVAWTISANNSILQRIGIFVTGDQAILKDIKKSSARTQINSVLNYFLVKKGDIVRKKAIWEKRKLLGKTLVVILLLLVVLVLVVLLLLVVLVVAVAVAVVAVVAVVVAAAAAVAVAAVLVVAVAVAAGAYRAVILTVPKPLPFNSISFFSQKVQERQCRLFIPLQWVCCRFNQAAQ